MISYQSGANKSTVAPRLRFTWSRSRSQTTDRIERQDDGRHIIHHPRRNKSGGTAVDVVVVAPVTPEIHEKGDRGHAFPDHSPAPDRNGQLAGVIANLSLSILRNGIPVLRQVPTLYSVGLCLKQGSVLFRLHEGPRQF